jgi:hypothetical protein
MNSSTSKKSSTGGQDMLHTYIQRSSTGTLHHYLYTNTYRLYTDLIVSITFFA